MSRLGKNFMMYLKTKKRVEYGTIKKSILKQWHMIVTNDTKRENGKDEHRMWNHDEQHIK